MTSIFATKYFQGKSKFTHDCLSHLLYAKLSLVLLNNRYNLKKLTYDERKASLLKRLNAINSSGGADDDDEDDE